MRKLFPLLILFLLSCGQNKRPQAIDDRPRKDTILELGPDSNYHSKDAFHWNWEKPTEKIILPAAITKYIAKGHEPIDSFTADINEDGFQDLLIVTGVIGEDSLRYDSLNHDLPRYLLVFLGQKDNQYKFSFRNSKAIPCIGCCGMTDPYNGMSVNNGRIAINEYCASNCKSVSEYRFHYKSKLNDWLLDTIINESYCFDFQEYHLDTTTKKDFGKVSLKTFVMHEDDK